MKIYAGVCGIGLGHMARSIPILKEFQKAGHKTYLSTYGDSYSFALKENLNPINSPALLWAEEQDGSVSLTKSIVSGPKLISILAKQYLIEAKRLNEFKPDMVYCDSRYTTLYAAIKKNIPVYLISNIVHYVGPKFPFSTHADALLRKINYKKMSKVEKILIPDLPAPYTISRNNLDAPKHIIEKISFVGINAPFVGSKSSAPTKKEIKKVREDLDFNDLFLYVPLSGPKKLRVSLIPTIIKAANNLKINTLIVTGDPKHELNKEKGYVKIVNWVKDKKVMLASCDFTVSRSGLSTIGENIMCAVPSVLIPPPRQREQEINAESMASMGAAVNLKQSKLFFRSKLEKTIKETIDNLSEIKKNVKKLSAIANKFNPTKTIVSEILNNSKSY